MITKEIHKCGNGYKGYIIKRKNGNKFCGVCGRTIEEPKGDFK